MRIIPIKGTVEIDRTLNESNRFLFSPHFFWLALVPLLVFVLSLASTLSPNDFWGHVAAGRWMAQNGAIPTTNIFSWGVPPETPYPYPSWGAAWLMFQTLNWTGFTGIVAMRAVCAASAWAILCAVAWHRVRRAAPNVAPERAAQIVTFAALLAFGMAGTNLDARPQMFALPLFALATALLFDLPHQTRPRFALLSVVFAGTVLWANAHGSFFLALALPLGALVGEGLSRVAKRGFFGESLPAAKLVFLAAWAAVAFLATLVNPHGVHVWDYVFTLTSNQTVQQYIYEWQPPRFGEGPGTVFFGGFALCVALVMLCAAKKTGESGKIEHLSVRAGEVLVFLALFTLGCRSLRSVLWFALLFIPVAASFGARYIAARSTVEIDRTSSARGFVPKVLCSVLLVATGILWPSVKARMPWPQAFRSRYAPSPRGEIPFILDATTPVAAAAFLVNAPPRRLWNDMGQGAYLAWALPSQTARCDWRIELFPNSFWLEYLRLSQGPPDSVAALHALGISDVLCDREAQKGLIERLSRAPGWQQHNFQTSVLFHKRSD
ncbi:MAG TPA: hypothetical protein VF681_03410 [Abditibacteriaceae bacterium]|jgi:hypothetical protein